jgi:hypothetical protein
VVSTTIPVYLGQGQLSNAQIATAMKGVNGGQALPSGGTINIPGQFGGQVSQDFNPNSKGAPNVQLRSGGTYLVTPTMADVYQQPIVDETAPAQQKKIRGKADHPEVLDALLKITDQKYPGYGFNQDRWRRWWATEKVDRELQNSAPSDRVISSSGAAK